MKSKTTLIKTLGIASYGFILLAVVALFVKLQYMSTNLSWFFLIAAIFCKMKASDIRAKELFYENETLKEDLKNLTKYLEDNIKNKE